MTNAGASASTTEESGSPATTSTETARRRGWMAAGAALLAVVSVAVAFSVPGVNWVLALLALVSYGAAVTLCALWCREGLTSSTLPTVLRRQLPFLVALVLVAVVAATAATTDIAVRARFSASESAMTEFAVHMQKRLQLCQASPETHGIKVCRGTGDYVLPPGPSSAYTELSSPWNLADVRIGTYGFRMVTVLGGEYGELVEFVLGSGVVDSLAPGIHGFVYSPRPQDLDAVRKRDADLYGEQHSQYRHLVGSWYTMSKRNGD
ncbi:MAG TPA: hypothetical protein VGR21_12115 [Cryptosporangiaceae bacterium]|nr:hypothetical protein [Cryptosporangiaceae bacterium]